MFSLFPPCCVLLSLCAGHSELPHGKGSNNLCGLCKTIGVHVTIVAVLHRFLILAQMHWLYYSKCNKLFWAL